MKVIFLDIDGVLNSNEYFSKVIKHNIQGIEEDVDIEKIKLLKKILDETGAKVVLSSSWRYTKRAQELKKFLALYGINTTSTPYIRNQRGLEIKKYIVDNQNIIEDFVILDDEIFDSYDKKLLKKLVKVSSLDGLVDKNVDEIIKRFGRKKSITTDEFER